MFGGVAPSHLVTPFHAVLVWACDTATNRSGFRWRRRDGTLLEISELHRPRAPVRRVACAASGSPRNFETPNYTPEPSKIGLATQIRWTRSQPTRQRASTEA